MKRKIFKSLLAITPLLLASCGKRGLSVEQMKKYIDNIPDTALFPYYRVIGMCDYQNTYIEIDSEFTNDYKPFEYVPYARYNPGCYEEGIDPDIGEENIMNFNNGSRAYWTRMPLRIHKNSFYGMVNDGKQDILNSTSAYSILYHYMKAWADSTVKNADSKKDMEMNILKDGDGNFSGFTFSGKGLHSKISIDNFPMYADPSDTEHWPDGIDYIIYGPTPMYQNEIDATFNFYFEYNKDGWLTREYVKSVNYNNKVGGETQFCCEGLYTYRFDA